MKQTLLILFIALLTFQCKKEEPFKLGPSNSSVQLVDTFTVSLSTVYVDSLPTSSSTRLLVGKVPNVGMGSVTASSYFQVSLNPNIQSVNILQTTSTPVFDSLVLILNHVYTYGDTTTPFTLSVNRVNEGITYKYGVPALFNSSYFSYDQTPLATSQLNFSTADSLYITLPNQLGQSIFSLALNNDYTMTNNSAFQSFFNGIVLLPPSSAQAVFGFNASPIIRLYYHDYVNTSELHQYDFTTKPKDLHFNRIINNRTGTAISSFTDQYQEIAATNSSNEAYLLTGIELMPKFYFPTLNYIKTAFPTASVNRAELVIHPKIGTYDPLFYPPGRLVLYRTNRTNIPMTIIATTLTSIPEIVSATLDWESQQDTYYTYEITDFITNKLNNTDNDAALLLASLKAESANRAERLVLSNNNVDVKLRLYLSIF